MELAGRVYDVITRPENTAVLPERTRRVIPGGDDEVGYWRRVIRMAAMCHDVGHLPFSHAAEHELLPDGWDHERLSVELIRSPEMNEIWAGQRPPLNPDDIAKLAVGAKKIRHLESNGKKVVFTDWERLLSDVIVGDAFGVDRMDYLLRDSHHAGVPYGRFDHFRLIDTLRILPSGTEGSEQPSLGVEQGGLHTAEGLLLARYFMYSQVYMHPVRRIYDIHLKDFLLAWLPGGRFSTDIAQHLLMTDNEATSAMYSMARSGDEPLRTLAVRIIQRQHFREVYRRSADDLQVHPAPGLAIYEAACSRYGAEKVRWDFYNKADAKQDFPILMRSGEISSSLRESVVLNQIPPVQTDYVFVDLAHRLDAVDWLRREKLQLLEAAVPKEEG
jgi:HD superfamily phosphohydrolase